MAGRIAPPLHRAGVTRRPLPRVAQTAARALGDACCRAHGVAGARDLLADYARLALPEKVWRVSTRANGSFEMCRSYPQVGAHRVAPRRRVARRESERSRRQGGGGFQKRGRVSGFAPLVVCGTRRHHHRASSSSSRGWWLTTWSPGARRAGERERLHGLRGVGLPLGLAAARADVAPRRRRAAVPLGRADARPLGRAAQAGEEVGSVLLERGATRQTPPSPPRSVSVALVPPPPNASSEVVSRPPRARRPRPARGSGGVETLVTRSKGSDRPALLVRRTRACVCANGLELVRARSRPLCRARTQVGRVGRGAAPQYVPFHCIPHHIIL